MDACEGGIMDGLAFERRRLPRYILPGGVRPEEDPTGPPFEILDIGVGGVRFETDRRLPPGHRLRFWFTTIWWSSGCRSRWPGLA